MIVKGRFEGFINVRLPLEWSVPKSDWQSFKLRYFPAWLLTMFPVKWVRVPSEYSPIVKGRG